MKFPEYTIPEIFKNYPISVGIATAQKDVFPPYGFSIKETASISAETAAHHSDLLCDTLGVSRQAIFTVKQVHSNIVLPSSDATPQTPADGIVSNTAGELLAIGVADCCGVVLYDPIHNAIAVLHSGWRGCVSNIAAVGVQLMIQKYGSNPRRMLAWLSPCASQFSYRVQQDVQSLLPEYCTPTVDAEKGYFLDIRAAICNQLAELNVPEQNIEVSTDCTIAHQRLHSYRRDGHLSGRMAVFALMLQ